jgi:hypothetical protein
VHTRHPGWAQRGTHLHHHTYTAEQVIVAWEEPELFASELRAAFRSLR